MEFILQAREATTGEREMTMKNEERYFISWEPIPNMGVGSSFPGIGATSVYRSKFHQYRICYIIAYCGWPDALSRVARRILPQQSVS